MGLIREPDGVDFVIHSQPLTPRDVSEIQEWIRQQRATKATVQPSQQLTTTRWSHKKPQIALARNAAR